LKGLVCLKNILLLVVLSLLLILPLQGCFGGVVDVDITASGGASAAQDLSAETIADLIYSNIPFDDMMTKVPPASIKNSYGLPSCYKSGCAIYVSTGATPEELAVFEIDDVCTEDVIIEAANNRIEKQVKSYSSYAPKEVPKLESAVIYSGSGFVVVCVSADNSLAKDFIKDYI
jgi:hypothetical protein